MKITNRIKTILMFLFMGAGFFCAFTGLSALPTLSALAEEPAAQVSEHEHTPDENGACTYGDCEYQYVAKLTLNDVTTYYDTLADALDAASDGNTVTALVSMDEGFTIYYGISFTALEGVILSGAVTNNGSIIGGTFSGEVTNNGYIHGGTFNGAVTNDFYIYGGTFSGSVTNNYVVNGGTFNSTLTNNWSIFNMSDDEYTLSFGENATVENGADVSIICEEHIEKSAATCTTKATCWLCEEEYSEALGHDYDANGVCRRDNCGVKATAKLNETYYDTLQTPWIRL